MYTKKRLREPVKSKPYITIPRRPPHNTDYPYPEPYVFAEPDTWPAWIERFELFAKVSGLVNTTEKLKIKTLLYCLGPKVVDWMEVNFMATDYKSYEYLKQALQMSLVAPNNSDLVHIRYRFHSRVQGRYESFNNYYKDIRRLAIKSRYEPLTETLIRDKLIAGTKYPELRKKLERRSDISLKKVISMSEKFEQHSKNKEKNIFINEDEVSITTIHLLYK